jgi:hypothetical protein
MNLKKTISIFSILLLLLGCSNNNDDFSLIEKQIDNDLKQTDDYIEEEKLVIDKAFAIGFNQGINKERYDKLVSLSSIAKQISSEHFKAPENIFSNKEKLNEAYVNNVKYLIEFVGNDGDPNNDYLASSFNTIINQNFDSLFVGNSSLKNRIHLKLIYTQIKKAELKVWGYLNKSIRGAGLTIDYIEAFHQIDETSSNDTISGKIILDSHGSNLITLLHFGKIDSTKFSFDTGKSIRISKHIMYPAGIKAEVPLLGKYKTTTFKSWKSKKFKLEKENLINGKVEGVLELRCPFGTFFLKINRQLK